MKEKPLHWFVLVAWFLLVTAAVWRDPQLTMLMSHDSVMSSRPGKAWIDMNTSTLFSPSSVSTHVDVLAPTHQLNVNYEYTLYMPTYDS